MSRTQSGLTSFLGLLHWKIFALGNEGAQLWTREWARKIRNQVETILAGLSSGDVLVISAKGVEVFDFSFANELFGKLVMALPQEYPGRFLVVEHLTDYTRENLSKALESLNLAIIERRGRKLIVLGKIHPVDQQTLDAVAQAKDPVTAAALQRQTRDQPERDERATGKTSEPWARPEGQGGLRSGEGTV